VRLAEHPKDSPYRIGLEKNAANYAPLTPISFLERTADVSPPASLGSMREVRWPGAARGGAARGERRSSRRAVA
jgi:hypothetical protein